MTYREDDAVEDDRSKVERLAPATEEEVRVREVVRRHREAEQGDQAVSSRRRDTARGDKGSERDLTGQDGAQQQRAEDEHDRDSIARLASSVNLADPP